MPDVLRLPFSGDVIEDANGNPLSGAKIEVFDAGTTNQKTVYTDATLVTVAANPIETNASGVVPARYIGTGSWKATFKDSSDATLSNYNTLDNEPGAIDTSSFLTGTVSPSRAIVNKTTTFTTTADELGKQINADATGGSFTGSLLSAVTAGDGGDFLIKHSGTANEVTVTATGGQTIDGQTSFILQPGDSIVPRSDGANYHIGEAFNFTSGVVTITFDPSITPDFQYPGGTDYQITVTADTVINAPTNARVGTRGSFTFIMDGTGGHNVTFNSIFKGTASVNQSASGVTVISWKIRSATEIDFWADTGRYGLVGVIDEQQTSGTEGGTFTQGAWQTRTLNTIGFNLVGITLASNEFTLPPGNYHIEFECPASQVNTHLARLYDVTGAAAVDTGLGGRTDSSLANVTWSRGIVQVSISAENTYRIEHQCQSTKLTDGFGRATSLGTERYTRVKIWSR